MTRFNIGSLTRNFKRLLTFAALVLSTEASDSVYNYRIHKSLVKEALDKNLPLAFDHIGHKLEKRTHLTEVNATIEDLVINIKPINNDWNTLDSDLFFVNG